MDMQTVAEVKQIASQLGQPGSPGIKVEVHNRIGIEVSIDCTTEIKYYHAVML